MSERQRRTLADAFDREIDPLAKHATTFDRIDVDVFDLFIEDVLKPQNPVPKTVRGYERTIREWSKFMEEQGRHPACPNEDHVKRFVLRELNEKGNTHRTAKKKLWELNKIYGYWQHGAEFPHPIDYNPFMIAKKKLSLSTERVKEPPRIAVEESILSLWGLTLSGSSTLSRKERWKLTGSCSSRMRETRTTMQRIALPNSRRI